MVERSVLDSSKVQYSGVTTRLPCLTEHVKEGCSLPWKMPAPIAFGKGKLAYYTLVCQQPADFLMSVLKRGLSQSTLSPRRRLGTLNTPHSRGTKWASHGPQLCRLSFHFKLSRCFRLNRRMSLLDTLGSPGSNASATQCTKEIITGHAPILSCADPARVVQRRNRDCISNV